MKKKDVRLKGQLKMYMRWPIIMTVLLIAMNIWMYKIDRQAAGIDRKSIRLNSSH